MNKEKLKLYSYLTVTAVGALIFLYIFMKYLFVLALPFLIGWAVAFMVRPMAKKISAATNIPYRLVSATLTLLIVVGGIAIIVSALIYAVSESWGFLTGLAESDKIYEILEKITNPISGLLGDREGAAELEAHISGAVSSMISSLLSGLVSWITAFVVSVPRVLIFILVTVISSVYFSLDLEKINSFCKRKLPKRISLWLVSFKNKFLSSLLKYLRAYLIIMLVTFIIMLFGFLVLGVKYAVLLAFVVALLDALPLIGVGTVLIPWSIYNMFFGDFGLGIGLVVLFVVHEVVRQFAEPKIIGKNLGIPPILSLFLLYAGYFVFGLLGLLLIPVLSVTVNILINKEDPSEVG